MLTIVITDRKIQFPHCMSQIKNVIKQATKPSFKQDSDGWRRKHAHTCIYIIPVGHNGK